MNNKATYNYGKCHICGEQMREMRINQDFWLKGKLGNRVGPRRRLPAMRRKDCQGRRRATTCNFDLESQAPAEAQDHVGSCRSIRKGSGLIVLVYLDRNVFAEMVLCLNT